MTKKFYRGLADILSTKYTKVSVDNNRNYTTRVILGNNHISIICGYNTFTKKRWVMISDDRGEVLLPQTFLLYGRRCELNFNAEINDLHYYLTLKPINKKNQDYSNYDYEYWSNDFVMCFVGYEQHFEEILHDNYTLYLVGQA